MRILSKNLKSENGSAIIFFAFCMTVLLGICALVIDYGIVVHKRISISNAVDAAALAGAQELIFDSDNAEAVAKDYLEANGVDSLDAEVVVYDSDTKIRVTVNSEVNYYFARILGFNQGNVEATGAAMCAPVIGVYEGIRPFAIEKQTLEFGLQYVLKEGGGGGYDGNYGALALSGNGARSYVNNIINGYDGHLRVGDYVETEPGNMSGPTAQGVNTLISRCNHTPECTHDDYSSNCPRIITVIMVDTLEVNGRSNVRIAGFARFFLEEVTGHGNESIVTGRFLNTVMAGELGDIQDDFGLKGVKLIQ